MGPTGAAARARRAAARVIVHSRSIGVVRPLRWRGITAWEAGTRDVVAQGRVARTVDARLASAQITGGRAQPVEAQQRQTQVVTRAGLSGVERARWSAHAVERLIVEPSAGLSRRTGRVTDDAGLGASLLDAEPTFALGISGAQLVSSRATRARHTGVRWAKERLLGARDALETRRAALHTKHAHEATVALTVLGREAHAQVGYIETSSGSAQAVPIVLAFLKHLGVGRSGATGA